jgi:hypothetical protein
MIIFSFVDYGNVNYWYEKDKRDAGGVDLLNNQKLIIDIGVFFFKQIYT